ncbi:MAG TPA: hypothetical protein VIF57_15160 [Polyangia bacterium]|jgi:hypothetical protein
MNRAQAPAHVLLLAACAWLPACGLNQKGVDPPDDTIAYPASAVMDKNGDWLLVTNSNADLRYNDGTLMALSLDRATSDRTLNDPTDPNPPHPDWVPCDRVDYDNPRDDPNHPSSHYCCWDRVDNNILNCDERYYVGTFDDATAFANGDKTVRPGRSNVRIGSFAAAIVRQEMRCPANCDCGADATNDRLLLGVRGDTSLTWIDVAAPPADATEAARTPPAFNCTAPSGDTPPSDPFQVCDDAHRIINTPTMLAAPMEDYRKTQPVPLPDEPYALAIDYDSGLLYIGHLTGVTSRPFSGGFSLFDIAPRGAGPVDQPRFVAPFPSPFPPTSLGSVGITALNVHTNSLGQTLSVLASSRFTPQVSGLGSTATCPNAQDTVREIAAFPNGITYTSPLGGAETRGIAFIDNEQDGSLSRAFVLQRSPPTLIGFLAANMAPTDLLETCGSPTFLDKWDTGVGDRLFVTCFADGQIYVYDPVLPGLLETFTVGRGPAGLVFDKSHGRNVAYVVGFGDNNISVIDLVPGSRTEYHVIQRLGFPRTSPR